MITHLARGLLILGERWWSGPWIAEAGTKLEMWVRRGLKALLTVGVFRVACAAWWLFLAVLLVVVVKALRAATKDALGVPEKTAAAPTGAPAETTAGGLPEVSPQEFLGLLYDALGTARGVHLATLANALVHRVGGAWEVADVRALCEASGVPVRPTVRAPGRGPTVGVHRDDLKPLPAPSQAMPPVPVVGVVVAGQEPTTTPTTTAPATPTTPTRTRVGDQLIVSTDDPDNPARTHVQVIDIGRKKRA